MQFGILGPLQVLTDGRVVGVPAARQRVLLARLLTRSGQVVPAGTLAEIVWDGRPPEGALSTLRTYVMRLRQSLGAAAGGRVITRHPGYLITVGADELDLLRFATLCRDGRAAAQCGGWQQASQLLGDALALWRGAPLLDVPSRILHQTEVPQLVELRLQAMEWRIESGLHLGRHGELVAELRSLVAEQPLRERLHAQLILALYRCGRQGEALAAYTEARRVLMTELGVEPGDDLRELHRRILAADPLLAADPPWQEARTPAIDPPVPRPHQLPAVVRPFVGRAAELRLLTGLASEAYAGEGAVAVLAIGGTAGVGKTALALRLAHQVAGQFPDGQLHVNLDGFGPAAAPLPAAEAIRGFLDALAVPPGQIPSSLSDRAALYRSLLAGRRTLIVLDNARDASQIRPLLPGSPAALVIITSRCQLTSLAAAEAAPLVTLDILSAADARNLLITRIGSQRAAAEPAAVQELALLCAHLPLALAIIAARAAARPACPLATLAAELRDAGSRLDLLDTGDEAASIRSSFSWSYRQLGDEPARMFRLAGVHPGPGIGVAAAASAAGIPADAAERALRDLTAAHLLTESSPGLFTCHDLLRAYAAEQARPGVRAPAGSGPARTR